MRVGGRGEGKEAMRHEVEVVAEVVKGKCGNGGRERERSNEAV